MYTYMGVSVTAIVREILSIRQDFARRRDGQGLTPLHIAATKGHLEITRELLKMDSDLCFLKDNEGRSPLHAAAIKGRIAILEEILSASLESASMVTNQGETILHLCVKNNQIDALRYLVEKLDITQLINLPDSNGNTVLHLATAGKLSVVRTSHAKIIYSYLASLLIDKFLFEFVICNLVLSIIGSFNLLFFFLHF